jgi:tRNA(Ile)-lysidine synthase TilS/MesJ
MRDIVALLAYIAEFAGPVEYEGEIVLLGGLYKLQPDHGISRRPLIEIPFRKTLPFKTIIRICSIEPTLNEDKEIVQNVIKQSLKPLTE